MNEEYDPIASMLAEMIEAWAIEDAKKEMRK